MSLSRLSCFQQICLYIYVMIGLVASPLAHMRELQASATGDGPAQLEAKRHVQLSGAPYFIHFATSHTKVVVVVRADDNWALEIFNAEDVCKEGSGDVSVVSPVVIIC